MIRRSSRGIVAQAVSLTLLELIQYSSRSSVLVQLIYLINSLRLQSTVCRSAVINLYRRTCTEFIFRYIFWACALAAVKNSLLVTLASGPVAILPILFAVACLILWIIWNSLCYTWELFPFVLCFPTYICRLFYLAIYKCHTMS